METENQVHPTDRQLAALALGKIVPEARERLRRHVAGCETCKQFLDKTPRDTLIVLLRNKPGATNIAEHSTPGVRDAATLSRGPGGAKPGRSRSGQSRTGQSSQSIAPGTSAGSAPDEQDVPRELREQSKYRVERLLGRGGMGSVFAAYHERMDRPVAIKVINSALVDHPEALNRFDQEVKAAAKLDHPNVARAYDADEFGSLRVLVMEYVPGQSLDRLLNARGRLTVVEACRLMRQAMIGLDHAHARGMVHRDLKPQNMMLTPTGKLKILDFGLAKIASEQRAGAGLTRDNALMGTPHYLAPEQALDAARADIRADIYSLGCTLYCLLSGSPPFNGDTEMKVLLAHQNDTPRPLCEVNREVPRELSDLVDRMLAKNPDDRPQTPKEVAEALLPFAKGEFTPPAEQPADPFAFLQDRAPAIADDTPVPTATILLPEAKPRRGIWTRAVIAASMFLALAMGAWALGVFTLRTPAGTIIIENLPDDVDVHIDGSQATLTHGDDAVRITAVEMGSHHLQLLRDGKDIWTSDAMIEVGGQVVRVKYIASANETAPETETEGGKQQSLPASARPARVTVPSWAPAPMPPRPGPRLSIPRPFSPLAAIGRGTATSWCRLR